MFFTLPGVMELFLSKREYHRGKKLVETRSLTACCSSYRILIYVYNESEEERKGVEKLWEHRKKKFVAICKTKPVVDTCV